jgi:hypothetical protein
VAAASSGVDGVAQQPAERRIDVGVRLIEATMDFWTATRARSEEPPA